MNYARTIIVVTYDKIYFRANMTLTDSMTGMISAQLTTAYRVPYDFSVFYGILYDSMMWHETCLFVKVCNLL